jgi:hypothetical protein
MGLSGGHSVRSTNVYEEQSLGVFYDKPEDHVDDEFTPVGPRSIVWGRYLASHARKQLSFGAWGGASLSGVVDLRGVQTCGGSGLRCSSSASSRSGRRNRVANVTTDAQS